MTSGLTVLFAVIQIAYLICLLITLFLYTRQVDLVEVEKGPADLLAATGPHPDAPDIIVLYPVLDELEATMRTSMLGFERAPYPQGRRRVVAIPNSNDTETIASLRRVAAEYPFLDILEIPPTSDSRWERVWGAWNANTKAYWWHHGKREGERALPPKKTRQLVYALYTMAAAYPGALLSYIDADSVVPADYFIGAAVGIQQYDVLQNTNVCGNALASWATSMFAMDHMLWDGSLYQHQTAGGKQPFYVLGKGLFFKISDLLELGGFNPWLTIEDPEVGMRLWTNGRRLGIIRSPLIEEVPATFRAGLTQRKRWIAGFFQSLGAPLHEMGMTLSQRLRARLNFVPCGSLILNPIGIGIGIWAVVQAVTASRPVFPTWLQNVCFVTIALSIIVVATGQRAAIRQTGLIWADRRERARFLVRVNPLSTLVYWIWWAIPLSIGFAMYVSDRGQRWERTPKIDANHELVRDGETPIIAEAESRAAPDVVTAKVSD
jgi:glycosyltransferase XagB